MALASSSSPTVSERGDRFSLSLLTDDEDRTRRHDSDDDSNPDLMHPGHHLDTHPHSAYYVEAGKTPRASYPSSFEGGALREGEVLRVGSMESVGLLAQYATVGLLYAALPGTIYPFLLNYLNVEGRVALAARTLMSVPWSFKVFFGFLTDCFPIRGYRRRPYILIGWCICLAMLFLMASQPIGPPYYSDPRLRKVKPELYTAADIASINVKAKDQGGKYVIMMAIASMGYLLSDVTADAMTVEYAQREPEAIRGRTQTIIYFVRQIFMVIANALSAVTFDGKEYGGDFHFSLSYPQFLLMIGVIAAPVIPITLFALRDKPYKSPGFGKYLQGFWNVLQSRAVIQVIAYKFFAGFFENFSFVAADPMQTYWAKVTPFAEKVGNILLLGVMAFTLFLTGRFGLNSNWRMLMGITELATIALDASCTFLVTWNICRSQYLWLGIPILEQLPYGVHFIVSTYVVVELANEGNEAAIYGLLTTVQNLSDPFAKTMSKNVNAPFGITNTDIQNDTMDVRWKITTTLIIMYSMNLLSLAWLPLLPSQKRATQRLKMRGGRSETLGFVTVMYILFAIVWSVCTNLMSLFPSTSCLIIAGGDGCGNKKT